MMKLDKPEADIQALDVINIEINNEQLKFKNLDNLDVHQGNFKNF